MNRLETTFKLIFWRDLLQRFNVSSKLLQSVNIDICTVCEHYNTLIKYISNLRNNEMFLQNQKKALIKCDVNVYLFMKQFLNVKEKETKK